MIGLKLMSMSSTNECESIPRDLKIIRRVNEEVIE